ncbi:uncharacterized protein LOC103993793 isoform X1 [Musa acuminata AAA Group]|uniref:uncharacterized protein LOC103993793 isoform X1 n=1 Tax=Musa acuminata AAA Group TaxID=214697 RepID=UPI0008A0B026|nr:PREDICTED: uncharacterized protein LOC103993793 isoform X1 [Musa acuminata subsp. malaccensis]XP_018685896.1 PREDICTED: uncharacterized protein LOC103993793 isoform X1 [Musa acuminata subsp. malaccensis]XP_018685897.1 PREDICTED: uncharacterized protein LOC103993793 isoform X1 [Musa acuminata subsp. malaccensis]
MERAIEIRSLDGRSITVSISSDSSIGDLKAMLKESSFLPAKKSPRFHLFFKGSKLSLDGRVDDYPVEHGEFMVLVPFIKKSGQIPVENGPPVRSPPNRPLDSVPSPAADMAWRDIMNDLSSLSGITKDEITRSGPSNYLSSKKGETSVGERCRKTSMKRTCKRKLDDSHVLLRDLLCSDEKNIFDQLMSDRIRCIVESVCCLCNADSGSCLLFEEYFRSTSMSQHCVCPSWLKRVLKNFTFINILCALFQIQKKFLTWKCIDEALKQPGTFGLENTCGSDVENLSLLCPLVVLPIALFVVITLCEQRRILNKLDSAILICNSINGQHEVTNTSNKEASTSSVIRAFDRRNYNFISELWKAIKCCMDRKLASSISLLLPLEDIILMKDIIALSESSDTLLFRKKTSLCSSTHIMEPAEMVEHLREGIGKQGQIVHVEQIDAKEAAYVELPTDLTEALKLILKGLGITRLYSHQAEAIRASLSGKHVVVATSTSSGKSLCYNMPVLEALSKNTSSCALYIFPTKALAQDQLRTLLKMISGLDIGLEIGVYDGDTSKENRKLIRDGARLLITNPDMLHMSILPFHRQFQRILSNLRYIVIDETHAYKGAFGCHTALILRRLCRICSHVYGSDPSFIFCTATSANPREHAMVLSNLQTLELIQNDGSPCGPKYFILWNPPLNLGQKTSSRSTIKKPVKREKASSRRNNKQPVQSSIESRRSSPILEVSYLLAEMVQHGLRCIAFCKTRKLSELVLSYTREILQATAKDLANSIYVYRAGYSPQERRRIETDLFEGKILGVAATNALELGIDIGHIDATLHLGFPGSVASLWQQAGRSGRRARPSLAVYVAFEGPLDQYFMKFPQKLFGSPIEHCQVDANNQKVLEQHIACAASELPLCLQYDENYFGSGLGCAIVALKNKGYLGTDPCVSPKLWNYIGPEKSPSHAVSIRAVETNKYKVMEKISNEVLEEIEESTAFFQVYEGAVYMNQGNTYLVKDLDLSAKVGFCQKADLNYYTKTRDYTDIHVSGGDLAYPLVKESGYVKTTARTNACKVTTKWFGFYRISRTSNQILDTVDLNLPTFSYESQAAWIRVPQSIKTILEAENLPFRSGLHAASHALLNVVPLYIMCNATDLATECVNPHETRAFAERILLYDRHPGGIGIAAQVQLLFRELLTAALELISTCGCTSTSGCPNCIQVLSCGEYNEVIHKDAAVLILKSVIKAETAYFEGGQVS